jgi:hypothetical protein
MCATEFGGRWAAVLIAFVSVSGGYGQTVGTGDVATTEKDTRQVLDLPIRVIDKQGNPIPEAKVTPWALRSSQGHGLWRRGDKLTDVEPRGVSTDENGMAAVGYPRFRNSKEQTRTISVSLAVDHQSFAYRDDLHIDVPLETSGPHVITLTVGIPLAIRPLVDGRAVNADDILAFWSDGRSWLPGVRLEKLTNGNLRIPAMLPGDNSVLLVKLDGERATHFSKIHDLKIGENQRNKLDISLERSLQIKGVLSDNVPRPVRHGRVKAATLDPADAHHNRVSWFTWVPVQPDGTFVIDWPAGEQLQLIALCEGYIATSGKAPAEVKNPRDPKSDPFNRAQVFDADDGGRLEVAMTPLVRCVASAVDEDGKPIAGVTVESWPNVGWWNSGSQIYCHPLVRGERLLRERDFRDAIDEAFPQPFQAVTAADGRAMLELPAGKEELAVSSEVYELPVFLGHRDVSVTLVRGETTEVALSLQPRGTEKLGEWDKLAGVVFGCSTREGRRICALPAVQKRMDEFTKRFREGKNQRDPKLLSEAYAAVADAFLEAGDRVEAVKWQQKAEEQRALAKALEPSPALAEQRSDKDVGWSKPIKGLRARLSVQPSQKADSPFCRVFIEFENVDDVAGQKRIRYSPDKLSLRVTDTQGKDLPAANGPYDGSSPVWETIALPYAGTLRFQTNFPGLGYRPNTDKVIVDVDADKAWIIPQDGTTYYLSGSLSIKGQKSDHRHMDWSGTLELPKVEIPKAK